MRIADRPLRIPSPGPYDVTRREYDFGDRAFRPTDLGAKVEVRADVHFPTGLPDGPYPTRADDARQPCIVLPRDARGIPLALSRGVAAAAESRGVRLRRRRLASYGYVVVSVSANGVNVLGNALPDTGMRQRGELLEEHLDLWRSLSTAGGEPFGDRFVGAVDMTRIGTMGHSRGR